MCFMKPPTLVKVVGDGMVIAFQGVGKEEPSWADFRKLTSRSAAFIKQCNEYDPSNLSPESATAIQKHLEKHEIHLWEHI